MLLNELQFDNFMNVLGEAWDQRVDHQQSDKFTPKEYDDMEGGAFWINAYTDDVLQGQLSHVEMIRQNPKAFGLTPDGMPTGELENDLSSDPEYNAWLDRNDPNDSKLKYGVFMDGWIRGSYEQDMYLEITGISPAIRKASNKILDMVDNINPNKVVVEIMDEGAYRTTFVLPSEENKLKGFIS